MMDLIVARAPALRASGVTSLAIGDVSFTLGDPVIVLTRDEAIAAATAAAGSKPAPLDEPPADTFDDPSLYGRTNGTPGFNRPGPRPPRKAST